MDIRENVEPYIVFAVMIFSGPVTAWIVSSKAEADTGFITQPDIPMARHRAASSGLFNAVRRITFFGTGPIFCAEQLGM